MKIPPPVAAGGDIGVHLSYIRRDIDEIKHTQAAHMTEIKAELHELKGAYVTRPEFKEMRDDLEKKVSREEFDPVKRVVYGVVSLILVGVVGALIALVIRTT